MMATITAMINQAIQFFDAGGWVMYPLLLLSILSATCVIERLAYWFLGSQSGGPRRLARYLNLLAENDSKALKSISSNDRSPEGKLVRFALSSSMLPTEAQLFAQVDALRAPSERFSSFLGVIIAAAPLLGILGTVTGIIHSFDLLGEASAVSDPTVVAGGIAEALYTTAFGLSIALITLFPHVLFKARAERSLSRLEVLAGVLAEHYERSASPSDS